MGCACRVYAVTMNGLGQPKECEVRMCAMHAAAPALLAVLRGLNHMGGDERGGYCICSRKDGSAPDNQHSTSCSDARTTIAKAEGRAL